MNIHILCTLFEQSVSHSLAMMFNIAELFTLVLSDLRRPNFISRLCDCCCCGGAGRVIRSKPKRPSFARRHCEFDNDLWHIHQPFFHLRETQESAPQSPARYGLPSKPCALPSSPSPNAAEPCTGRNPRRQSPRPAREHRGSAPRARPGYSAHRPASSLGSAHCAGTGEVGASNHYQNDKRPLFHQNTDVLLVQSL